MTDTLDCLKASPRRPPGDRDRLKRYDERHAAGLNAVWGTSSSDIYAVGSSGTILHYDGVEWSAMVSGTETLLEGVWGTSSGGVYAAGRYGVILRGTR